MSCYEWERGSIKLPAGEMTKVRKAVVEAHNAARQRIFDKANATLPKLLAAGKGKRNFNYLEALRTVLVARDYYGRTNYDDDTSDVEELLFPYRVVERDGHKFSERVKRPVKPKKKDVGLLGARADGVRFEDASIAFDKDGRMVHWHVGENNHARERARAHPIARAFFSALNRITWTRGSGGDIVGNDEYNRDSDYEGGGGNYLIESFGPESKSKPRGRFRRHY